MVALIPITVAQNDELDAIVFIRFIISGRTPKSRTRQRKVDDGLEQMPLPLALPQ